jgi:hypothetical protein
MLSRFLLTTILLSLFVCLVFAWGKTPTPVFPPMQPPQPSDIRILISQLPTVEGIVPVEISSPRVSSNAPNEVEDVTYVIRNNTDKVVSALAVRKTVSYIEGGEVSTVSTCSTSDYAFHPDITGPHVFAPHTAEFMDSAGPMRFGTAVTVKEVQLQVDYVLFQNDTAIGRGGEGDKKINSMRLGARKYKGWLMQRYAGSGKSVSAILPLLKTGHAPPELDLSDIDQTVGAPNWRRFRNRKLPQPLISKERSLVCAGVMVSAQLCCFFFSLLRLFRRVR